MNKTNILKISIGSEIGQPIKSKSNLEFVLYWPWSEKNYAFIIPMVEKILFWGYVLRFSNFLSVAMIHFFNFKNINSKIIFLSKHDLALFKLISNNFY